jgi:TolB protein
VRRALIFAAAAAVAALAVSGAGAQSTDTLPGRMLFIKDGDLWVWQTGGAYQLATGGTWSQPAWSPDGASLAYVYRGVNFADIFITDDRGTSQRRLTESQSTVLENNDWNFRPAWSPDGNLIAFVSDRASELPSLWLMNAADGRGQRALPTAGLFPEVVDSLAWSPDGSHLAMTIFNEPGPPQIALLPMVPSSRQPGRVLTSPPGGGLDPAWSPDGGWIAYAGHIGPTLEVFAVLPDGSSVQQLTQDGFLARSPVWSPDGRHIAYLSNRSGYFEVWVIDIEVDASGMLVPVGRPRQVTRDLSLDAASGLSWGP